MNARQAGQAGLCGLPVSPAVHAQAVTRGQHRADVYGQHRAGAGTGQVPIQSDRVLYINKGEIAGFNSYRYCTKYRLRPRPL